MDFRILGPLEITDAGRLLQIGPPKERALLALLLLNANEVVSRDRLIDDLWGEDPPDSAVAVVQTYVSHLRKVLPDGRIVTRARGYLIEIDPEDLDLRRFERLVAAGEAALDRGDAAPAADVFREALELWRGPALADFAYEPFAQPATRRLEELRLGAVDRRIDAELALGGRSGTVAELEELVRRHPLRERFREQLMLALYRAGRQADALATYDQARRTLVDELGLEPGRALQELHRAILRQDASLHVRAQVAASAESVEPRLRSLLVVASDDTAVDAVVSTAEPLARSEERELIVLRLLPEGTNPTDTTARLARLRDELEARGVRTRVAAYTSGNPAEDVVRLAAEQDVDLTLVDAPRSLLDDGVPPPELARVLRSAVCDVAVLVGAGLPNEAKRPVVVPFGGADHDWAAVELGAWTAHALRTTLRLVGTSASPFRGRRDASRLIGRVSLVLQAAVGIVCEPVLVRSGAAGVLEAAADGSLLVVGLSARWSEEGIGLARLEIARSARIPVLLVRKGPRPGGLAPRERLTRFTWTLGGG